MMDKIVKRIAQIKNKDRLISQTVYFRDNRHLMREEVKSVIWKRDS